MKILTTIIIELLFLTSFCQVQNEKPMREEMKFLEPITGKSWHCEDVHPVMQQKLHLSFMLEPMHNGKILKISRYCDELNNHTDGYCYYDPMKKEIAIISLNSNGNYSKGYIIPDEGKILVYGQTVFPDKTIEFKNTLEINSDGKLEDKYFWFDGEKWNAGHSRVYEYSEENL